MRSFLVILIALLYFKVSSFAQNTITVKAQVLNTTSLSQKKMKLQVNGRTVTTNDSGYFQVVLPKTNTHLLVSLVQSEFVVIYPLGGYVPIPRELKDITPLIIGNIPDLFLFKQYLSLPRQEDTAYDEESGAAIRRDSLKKELLRLHITEAQIENAEKSMDEKALYVLALCADVMRLRNQVFELKTNFRWLAEKAMTDGEALDQLLRSVSAYNNSFQKFDRQHAVYETMKFNYWRNDYLVPAVRNFSDFIILKVHAEGVYPMQELILQIRQYFSGKKKNKDLKRSIEQQIRKHVDNIEKWEPELERRTVELIMAASAM